MLRKLIHLGQIKILTIQTLLHSKGFFQELRTNV